MLIRYFFCCKLDEDGDSGSQALTITIPRTLHVGSDYICKCCLNLDKNLFPTTGEPHFILDDIVIAFDFSQLEASVAMNECERCILIHTALTEMHKQWNDAIEDREDMSWCLDGLTKLEIYVREGHSLRVWLMNMRKQQTFDFLRFEFYTHTPLGWLA